MEVGEGRGGHLRAGAGLLGHWRGTLYVDKSRDERRYVQPSRGPRIAGKANSPTDHRQLPLRTGEPPQAVSETHSLIHIIAVLLPLPVTDSP